MDSETRTVYVVDDSPEVRASLSRLLGIAGYRVRAFESAESFLREHDVEAPGCLLLDVRMPGLSGPELQHSLASSGAVRPIVFLTGNGDIQTSVLAMKQGAVDFLTKPVDAVCLFAAVDHALRRDAEQRLQRSIRHTIQQRLEILTPRERQVMAQVIRGRLNKQIAADLGTGEKTVKVHRARVMSKMMVRSVAELVQLGARVGVSIEPTAGFKDASINWKETSSPTRERSCEHDAFFRPRNPVMWNT
jgi:FixJ family two-component response regulator